MIHAPNINPNERRWLFILGGVGSALAINNTLPTKYRVQNLVFHRAHTPPAPTSPVQVPVTGNPPTAAQGLIQITYQYRFNHLSCLYFYEKIGHYADGATKPLGMVVQQHQQCAGLPPIQYLYLRFVKRQGPLYKYRVMAVFRNGTQKAVANYVTRGPVAGPRPTVTARATPMLAVQRAQVGGS